MTKTQFQAIFVVKTFHFFLPQRFAKNCQLQGLPLAIFSKMPKISRKSQKLLSDLNFCTRNRQNLQKSVANVYVNES